MCGTTIHSGQHGPGVRSGPRRCSSGDRCSRRGCPDGCTQASQASPWWPGVARRAYTLACQPPPDPLPGLPLPLIWSDFRLIWTILVRFQANLVTFWPPRTPSHPQPGQPASLGPPGTQALALEQDVLPCNFCVFPCSFFMEVGQKVSILTLFADIRQASCTNQGYF